jgi:hypothetical protein
VPLKRKLREFPVTEDALLPVGTTITVRHFLPGQFVDVTGITKGKGFAVCIFPVRSIFVLSLVKTVHYIAVNQLAIARVLVCVSFATPLFD